MQIPIKSGSEQDAMREGGKILALILESLKERAVPGATKKELDDLARRFCLKYKVKPSFLGYGDFPAALCVSLNNEVVHGIPDETILKKGDLVSLDMGVENKGFHTDSAVSIICGQNTQTNQKNNPELAKIADLIKTAEKSFYSGVDLIQDGVRLGDVSAKIQETAENKGYGVIRMLVGHGIGREVHEDPHVPNFGTSGTGPILKAGMTIAIEPMLIMDGTVDVFLEEDKWTYSTKSGSLATHFEHTVLVLDDGYEILTDLK